MDFKEFLEYRSDQDSETDVIATDLLQEELIPYDLKDDMLLKIIDNSFVETPVYENWKKLKADYLEQKD